MSKPVALVTGASRGLGAELAKALSLTHHIIAVSRTIGALEALDDQIKARGGSSTLAPIDLTDENAIAQLCRSIFDRWGKVKLWAHTAIHAAPLVFSGTNIQNHFIYNASIDYVPHVGKHSSCDTNNTDLHLKKTQI